MIKKYLLILTGLTALTLGIIGIFVPLLPTTPFLLLSAGCFLKSSKPLYGWLIQNKYFGRYIRNYLKYRAVSKTSKIFTIVILWIVILISFIFYTELLWLRIILVVVAIGVTIHLAKLRTLTKEMTDENKSKN
jgi:hypothetical protein